MTEVCVARVVQCKSTKTHSYLAEFSENVPKIRDIFLFFFKTQPEISENSFLVALTVVTSTPCCYFCTFVFFLILLFFLYSVMASSLSEDCDLQNLSENDFTSCVFKSATRNGHPTIQIVLLEWLICPDDDIAQFEQARYVYFYNVYFRCSCDLLNARAT
jgi:hypothetical protein